MKLTAPKKRKIKKQCQFCGNDYVSSKHHSKFCSRECCNLAQENNRRSARGEPVIELTGRMWCNQLSQDWLRRAI